MKELIDLDEKQGIFDKVEVQKDGVVYGIEETIKNNLTPDTFHVTLL